MHIDILTNSVAVEPEGSKSLTPKPIIEHYPE
jgi:hypothetical protein